MEFDGIGIFTCTEKFHCNSAVWMLDHMIADVLPALSPDSEFLPPRQRGHTGENSSVTV